MSNPSAKRHKPVEIRIGTAGWTLPGQHAHHFRSAAPGEKLSHLERYAHSFNCVEINSSFHRPHQRKTWERWAATTPAGFRFAVKLPKAITHTAKLMNCGAQLQEFFAQCSGLDSGSTAKLGALLVQLPPSLAFDAGIAHEFLTTLRELHPIHLHEQNSPTKFARNSSTEAAQHSLKKIAQDSPLDVVQNQRRLLPTCSAAVVFEPRHTSWFTPAADRLLRDFAVARAAADPPKGPPLAAKPGGWPGLSYFRLHGAPRTYYSDYTEPFLAAFAATHLRNPPVPTWVIFDNTALGHATVNALTLQALALMPTPP